MYLLVVISPFLGSAMAGLCGRWLGARGASIITVFSLFISFMCSAGIFYEVGLLGCSVYIPLKLWFQTSSLLCEWSFRFDRLTACMLITVTFVSLCVHIYSISYMQSDPHMSRFMSYLSLFTGFMIILVTANHFAQMLVGWEGIGVCSYLLIGFFMSRVSATKSAVKAMLVNRVSDTLLLIGLMLIWYYYGSLDYDIMWLNTTQAYYTDFICFTLLCGACGKSAQLGFHIWLADAMEGPTPVSALIHAATLVTAGVFLIARTSALWSCSEICRTLLLIIGTFTCLVAATCGWFQNDIKKVIAYSTCSQLGYMMVSCSCSDYAGAIYHLMTHACFKALLFLSAGALIHNMSDIQDVRHYGGSQALMPTIYTCFIVGSLSLMGWPFLSGFYSKDAILELVFNQSYASSVFAYGVLILVACATSFYSIRILWLGFISSSSARQTENVHSHLSWLMAWPLLLLSAGSIWLGYMMQDLLIGLGTDFWDYDLATSVFHTKLTDSISNHELPSMVAWLPLCSVFTGIMAAVCYSGWVPTQWFFRKVYLFFNSTWLFNPVIEIQIVHKVVNFGQYTLSILDKGIFEFIGPSGIYQTLWSYVVPYFRHMQTGTVYDYALVYKICVWFGIAALIFPSFDLRDWSMVCILWWLSL